MRIMGIDYGDVRTGIACTDPLGIIVTPIAVIQESKYLKVVEKIMAYAVDLNIEEIVIGNPLHMNGSEGIRCAKSKQLQKILKRKLKIPVSLLDERCTTITASYILTEQNVRGKAKKEKVDMVAAMIILETYLKLKNKKVEDV